MNKKIIQALFFFVLSMFANANTNTSSPLDLAKSIVANASSDDIGKNKSKQREIEQNFDFEFMAKQVLLNRYSNIPHKDISWFEKSLKEILALNVYPKSADFFKNVSVEFLDNVTMTEGPIILKSKVVAKGELIEVDYQFEKIKGQWKVVDVIIDEESWVTNIKTQVQNALKRETWSDVKKKLDGRIQQLRKSLSDKSSKSSKKQNS